MKELAEEELKLLEAQHPSRFQYLKLQLKELIHLLDEGDKQQKFHSSIITQESSSSRKRKRKRQREGEKDEGCSKHKHKHKHKIKKGESTRDAIHKAEACLHKIQVLKSFFFSSNH